MLILASCEDVIDIELNSIEPKLVVEGFINVNKENTEVKLTKTTDFFNPEEYLKISDAAVTLRSESGKSHKLVESTPGKYMVDELVLSNNETYSLIIESEGEKYMASVQIPEKVEIKSLSYAETPVYMEFTGGSLVSCIINDPAGKENFYRFRAYAANNAEFMEENISVFNDAFVDGNEISLRWEAEQFFPGDTVVVELRSIDRASYDYYVSINSLLESGFVGSATPANPKTNIIGEALGFFGAYTVSRDTIIVNR